MARFILVKCKCGNEQKVFSTPSINVKCRVCNEIIAQPTGGKAALSGKYVKDVE
jgi:small subunit ribosomal protein S27e